MDLMGEAPSFTGIVNSFPPPLDRTIPTLRTYLNPVESRLSGLGTLHKPWSGGFKATPTTADASNEPRSSPRGR